MRRFRRQRTHFFKGIDLVFRPQRGRTFVVIRSGNEVMRTGIVHTNEHACVPFATAVSYFNYFEELRCHLFTALTSGNWQSQSKRFSSYASTNAKRPSATSNPAANNARCTMSSSSMCDMWTMCDEMHDVTLVLYDAERWLGVGIVNHGNV
jgi:hypothetical protein